MIDSLVILGGSGDLSGRHLFAAPGWLGDPAMASRR